MEKPTDTDSLAWYLHDFPIVFIECNGNTNNRRPLRYNGIRKNTVYFKADNGHEMKFTIDETHSVPIVFHEDYFYRQVSPTLACRYYYATDMDVKVYEWDKFFEAVKGKS